MSDAPTPTDKPSSAPPPSGFAQNRNAILMSLGGAVALGIPVSIHEIGNPIARASVSLVALVIVFGLGYFTTPAGKKQ